MISCENEIQSRKWKGKIKNSILYRAENGGCDTAGPIAPQPDIGSAHNLSRRQSVMSSCVCQSYGHFQHPVGELLAPPCFFSVIAFGLLGIAGDVCLLLQDLYKSCARGGGVKRGDVCYGMLRAAACVDESDHHALMYVRHGQTVREHGVDERSVGRP